MVALTSLMPELVNATIKYAVTPLEVGPEFAPIEGLIKREISGEFTK